MLVKVMKFNLKNTLKKPDPEGQFKEFSPGDLRIFSYPVKTMQIVKCPNCPNIFTGHYFMILTVLIKAEETEASNTSVRYTRI